jgi:hypothetical protein
VSILKASFDGTKFDQVQGFRISAAFKPGQGFGGHFFVYLLDYLEAKTQFKEPLKVFKPGTNPSPRRGTLQLASSDFTYTFDNIELSDAEIGATRARRYRLLEFRYPYEHQGSDLLVPAVKINSNWAGEKSLKPARLGDDYKYNLGSQQEHLLGFRARVTPHDANVLRFSGRRTKATSFLEKIMASAKGQVDGRMSPFTIGFSPKSIEVTQENLRLAYVDESHGYFTSLPLPSLGRVAATIDAAHARVPLADFRPMDLMHHNYSTFPDTENWMENSDVVETGTFVFEVGWFNDLDVK